MEKFRLGIRNEYSGSATLVASPSLLFPWQKNGSVSPHVSFIHIDCWTVFDSVYLLGINAVVAYQAGQLTDPEYRAIPSLVAAVVVMAGGIPVIPPQFHPHEEVSCQDDSPVFFILFCVYLSVFFPCLRQCCGSGSGIPDLVPF
jgi:hypothetical protein